MFSDRTEYEEIYEVNRPEKETKKKNSLKENIDANFRNIFIDYYEGLLYKDMDYLKKTICSSLEKFMFTKNPKILNNSTHLGVVKDNVSDEDFKDYEKDKEKIKNVINEKMNFKKIDLYIKGKLYDMKREYRKLHGENEIMQAFQDIENGLFDGNFYSKNRESILENLFYFEKKLASFNLERNEYSNVYAMCLYLYILLINSSECRERNEKIRKSFDELIKNRKYSVKDLLEKYHEYELNLLEYYCFFVIIQKTLEDYFENDELLFIINKIKKEKENSAQLNPFFKVECLEQEKRLRNYDFYCIIIKNLVMATIYEYIFSEKLVKEINEIKPSEEYGIKGNKYICYFIYKIQEYLSYLTERIIMQKLSCEEIKKEFETKYLEFIFKYEIEEKTDKGRAILKQKGIRDKLNLSDFDKEIGKDIFKIEKMIMTRKIPKLEENKQISNEKKHKKIIMFFEKNKNEFNSKKNRKVKNMKKPTNNINDSYKKIEIIGTTNEENNNSINNKTNRTPKKKLFYGKSNFNNNNNIKTNNIKDNKIINKSPNKDDNLLNYKIEPGRNKIVDLLKKNESKYKISDLIHIEENESINNSSSNNIYNNKFNINNKFNNNNKFNERIEDLKYNNNNLIANKGTPNRSEKDQHSFLDEFRVNDNDEKEGGGLDEINELDETLNRFGKLKLNFDYSSMLDVNKGNNIIQDNNILQDINYINIPKSKNMSSPQSNQNYLNNSELDNSNEYSSDIVTTPIQYKQYKTDNYKGNQYYGQENIGEEEEYYGEIYEMRRQDCIELQEYIKEKSSQIENLEKEIDVYGKQTQYVDYFDLYEIKTICRIYREDNIDGLKKHLKELIKKESSRENIEDLKRLIRFHIVHMEGTFTDIKIRFENLKQKDIMIREEIKKTPAYLIQQYHVKTNDIENSKKNLERYTQMELEVYEKFRNKQIGQEEYLKEINGISREIDNINITIKQGEESIKNIERHIGEYFKNDKRKMSSYCEKIYSDYEITQEGSLNIAELIGQNKEKYEIPVMREKQNIKKGFGYIRRKNSQHGIEMSENVKKMAKKMAKEIKHIEELMSEESDNVEDMGNIKLRMNDQIGGDFEFEKEIMGNEGNYNNMKLRGNGNIKRGGSEPRSSNKINITDNNYKNMDVIEDNSDNRSVAEVMDMDAILGEFNFNEEQGQAYPSTQNAGSKKSLNSIYRNMKYNNNNFGSNNYNNNSLVMGNNSLIIKNKGRDSAQNQILTRSQILEELGEDQNFEGQNSGQIGPKIKYFDLNQLDPNQFDQNQLNPNQFDLGGLDYSADNEEEQEYIQNQQYNQNSQNQQYFQNQNQNQGDEEGEEVQQIFREVEEIPQDQEGQYFQNQEMEGEEHYQEGEGQYSQEGGEIPQNQNQNQNQGMEGEEQEGGEYDQNQEVEGEEIPQDQEEEYDQNQINEDEKTDDGEEEHIENANENENENMEDDDLYM